LIIFMIIAVILLLLYLLAIKGQIGKHDFDIFKSFSYAHRGLHSDKVPENSMEAFTLALAHGYGIEFDVHLLKDGNLAVIHDSSLIRTAGIDVKIEDLTTEELKAYRLEETNETIPTFKQVLNLYQGKAPLIIELKSSNKNHGRLVDEVCRQLKDYKGAYCIESFDPRCLLWLKKNRPDVCRGQLAQNFFKNPSGMGKMIDFVLTFMLANFLTRPDFIAYKFSDRKNLSNVLCLKLWKLQGASWTLRNKAVYHEAIGEGLIPIFEKFEP